ncbi:MAG: GxxExxY protein [Rectinemataceae bacterium]
MQKVDAVERYPHRELTERIIGCALTVHTELGPGLLESVYEEAMTIEMAEAELAFQRQIQLPVLYKGQQLNGSFRADFVVENAIVLELKSVQLMHPVFDAQVLTYLKLGGWKVGLILNFGLETLRKGLKRIVL